LDRIFELPHVVKIVTILAILKKIGDKWKRYIVFDHWFW
jgi:hypothetical protein